jgi:hypothetical protein
MYLDCEIAVREQSPSVVDLSPRFAGKPAKWMRYSGTISLAPRCARASALQKGSVARLDDTL